MLPNPLQFLYGVLCLQSWIDVFLHLLLAKSNVPILVDLWKICENLRNKLFDFAHVLQNELHRDLILVFETQRSPQLFHAILVLDHMQSPHTLSSFPVRVGCQPVFQCPCLPVIAKFGSHLSDLDLYFLPRQEFDDLGKLVNVFLSITHLRPSTGNQIQVIIVLWFGDRTTLGLVSVLQECEEENAHLPFPGQFFRSNDIIMLNHAIFVPVKLVKQESKNG
mmetsp:Transcript_140888/g.245293  ORF Transcript_140888/g.245293 Transcript_140888/m.245293 type:complete len:221 (+) Transcript_140888:423-1085(+)